jgi:hypothetical protein
MRSENIQYERDWEEYPWDISLYYPGILLEGMKKATAHILLL